MSRLPLSVSEVKVQFLAPDERRLLQVCVCQLCLGLVCMCVRLYICCSGWKCGECNTCRFETEHLFGIAGVLQRVSTGKQMCYTQCP